MTVFIEIIFLAVNFANFILAVDTVFIFVAYITIVIGIPAGGGVTEVS